MQGVESQGLAIDDCPTMPTISSFTEGVILKFCTIWGMALIDTPQDLISCTDASSEEYEGLSKVHALVAKSKTLFI